MAKVYKLLVVSVLLSVGTLAQASILEFLYGDDDKLSSSFTEQMKGYFSTAEEFQVSAEDMEKDTTYGQAEVAGRNIPNDGGWFEFQLTIDAHVGQRTSDGGIPGTILSDAVYSNSPDAKSFVIAPQLTNGVREKLRVVDGGRFMLFDGDGNTERGAAHNKMRYFVKFCKDKDGDYGQCWIMHAFKNVRQDSNCQNPLEIWQDTSTLYITIFDSVIDPSLPKGNQRGERYHKSNLVDMAKLDKRYFSQINTQSRGNSPSVIGKGVLTIYPQDFIKQMTTMRGDGEGLLDRLKAVRSFGGFFASSLFAKVYTKCEAPQLEKALNSITSIVKEDEKKSSLKPTVQKIKENIVARPGNYALSSPVAAKDINFVGRDGKAIKIRMTRYQGKNSADKDPVLLIPGLGVNSGIFTQTYTNRNIVEYLTQLEQDVFVLDFRTTVDFETAKNGKYTGEDVAREDFVEALKHIRYETGKTKVHVLGHCFGSHSFLMGLLKGYYDKSQTGIEVASYIASQATLFLDVPRQKMAQINALSGVLNVAGSLQDTTDFRYFSARGDVTGYNSTVEGLFSTALSVYNRLGFDSSQQDYRTRGLDVHQRILFLYGPLYNLDQMNDGMMLKGLEDTFGVVGLGHLNHLQTMIKGTKLSALERDLGTARFMGLGLKGNQGHVMGAQGNDDYLTVENIKNNLDLPITIIHGSKNLTWLPSGSQKTLRLLQTVNPTQRYKLRIAQDYGHLDSIFGKNASIENGPYTDIRKHLEEVYNISKSLVIPAVAKDGNAGDNRTSRLNGQGNGNGNSTSGVKASAVDGKL